MSRDRWDPTQYALFSDERSRPFAELVARIPITNPSYVVDLGCGSGELTATLHHRWPNALIEGIDASPEMIAAAHSHATPTTPLNTAPPAPTSDPTSAAAADNAAAGGGLPSGGPVGGADVADVAASASGATAAVGVRSDGGAVDVQASGAVVGGVGGAGGVGGVRFGVGDVAEWRAGRVVDVIVSNAVLQWVPGHEGLLGRWVEALAPGGVLAFQVPGNFDAPSHVLLREVCESARWRERLGGVVRGRPVLDAAGYLELLSGLGCVVDAWETTYVQVLRGRDAVLEWVKGTALRPVLSVLGEGEVEEFLGEYGARLREAYPEGPGGTVFPFRRVFVVARRPVPSRGGAGGGGGGRGGGR